MPTDTTGIDDMDLAPPGVVRRRLHFSHEPIGQRPRADFPPIPVEVIDFEGDHLIALPCGHVDLLQDKIRTAEAQTRQTRAFPNLRETPFPERKRPTVQIAAPTGQTGKVPCLLASSALLG